MQPLLALLLLLPLCSPLSPPFSRAPSSRRAALDEALSAASLVAPSLLLPGPAGAASPAVARVSLSNCVPDASGSTAASLSIALEPASAPVGVEHFQDLVKAGFYEGCPVFRAIPGFVAQFGISPDPGLNKKYRSSPIQDDDLAASTKTSGGNTRGTLVFATAGKNTRTTQLFLNLADNHFLDKDFSVIGRVTDLAKLDRIYTGYGEGAPRGKGPDQGQLMNVGGPYMERFPLMTRVDSITLE